MAGVPHSTTGGGAVTPGDAAVRLLDEHDRRVVVLKPDAASPEVVPDPAAGHAAAWPGVPPDPTAAPDAASPEVAPDPAAAHAGGAARRSGRGLRALALTLILLGALALADAVTTLVWQEPFSALYAKLRQDHLSSALRGEERSPPTPAERQALASLASEQARIAFLAASLQKRAHDGSPVGRIRIPRIGASFVVVSGTSTSALESGPGIYPETVFPGRGGTTAIAGHRTTYLAPFRHIDELRPGNRIMLDMPYAHFTYTITGSAVVAPTDVRAAVDYLGYPRLVLSACTPLFSAAKRILVFARLQHTAPVERGRALPGGGAGAVGAAVAARALTSGARSRAAGSLLPARPAARPRAIRARLRRSR
jgi:sortase A